MAYSPPQNTIHWPHTTLKICICSLILTLLQSEVEMLKFNINKIYKAFIHSTLIFQLYSFYLNFSAEENATFWFVWYRRIWQMSFGFPWHENCGWGMFIFAILNCLHFFIKYRFQYSKNCHIIIMFKLLPHYTIGQNKNVFGTCSSGTLVYRK